MSKFLSSIPNSQPPHTSPPATSYISPRLVSLDPPPLKNNALSSSLSSASSATTNNIMMDIVKLCPYCNRKCTETTLELHSEMCIKRPKTIILNCTNNNKNKKNNDDDDIIFDSNDDNNNDKKEPLSARVAYNSDSSISNNNNNNSVIKRNSSGIRSSKSENNNKVLLEPRSPLIGTSGPSPRRATTGTSNINKKQSRLVIRDLPIGKIHVTVNDGCSKTAIVVIDVEETFKGFKGVPPNVDHVIKFEESGVTYPACVVSVKEEEETKIMKWRNNKLVEEFADDNIARIKEEVSNGSLDVFMISFPQQSSSSSTTTTTNNNTTNNNTSTVFNNNKKPVNNNNTITTTNNNNEDNNIISDDDGNQLIRKQSNSGSLLPLTDNPKPIGNITNKRHSAKAMLQTNNTNSTTTEPDWLNSGYRSNNTTTNSNNTTNNNTKNINKTKPITSTASPSSDGYQASIILGLKSPRPTLNVNV
jgi:hypothetical protein